VKKISLSLYCEITVYLTISYGLGVDDTMLYGLGVDDTMLYGLGVHWRSCFLYSHWTVIFVLSLLKPVLFVLIRNQITTLQDIVKYTVISQGQVEKVLSKNWQFVTCYILFLICFWQDQAFKHDKVSKTEKVLVNLRIDNWFFST
jgi:hypothetical protein